MWAALLLVIVVSFLTYVLCFGASSSGVIGQLNHFLTASVGGCVRAVLGKCFGKRWRSVLKVTWLTATARALTHGSSGHPLARGHSLSELERRALAGQAPARSRSRSFCRL